MFILNKLLTINSNTPRVKEAIGFNLANVGLIEGDGVAYGFSYGSKVKLLISPLYQSKTYEYDTDISVANEFKDQLSLTLIEDSAETDKVGIVFPEEGVNKEGEKYIKSLSFNTYEIKHSINVPSVEHLGKTKLQKNINNDNLANKDNSYSQPRAEKVDNGDVIVIAHNLKDKTLVSWYLKSDKSGKFKVLTGEKGVTERKLFKFGNPGQLVLNGNTMLYSQVRKNIVEDQEVRTNIFKFDMAKVIQDLRDRKRVDECLLGNRNGQINKAPSLSSEHEISFLQYVESGDLVAFLENDQSTNKQRLYLTSLVKNRPKSNFTVCEYEDPVEQLYVKDNDQGGFIATAVSGENVITFFNQNGSGKSSEVTIVPASGIKALSDFVNIINGRLTISSIPITVTKTVITSEKVSTAMITSTARTNAVKTTKLTTEAIASTSTISAELTTQTRSTTVGPTTTVASQTTKRVTTSTNVPSETEIGTVKPTAAIVTSTSTISTELTTVEPTTADVTSQATPIVTSETETSTEAATVVPLRSTNAPTTLGKSARTVFTIPSAGTRKFTPQSTSSPQPTQLAIAGESNMAGIIAGSLLGIIGVTGIVGLMAYKYVKEHRRRNAAPVLELTDFGYRRRQSSSSSDEEIFTTSSRKTMHQSETALNSVSVEGSSRSRNSSSSSSSV